MKFLQGWGLLFVAIFAALVVRWAIFESYIIPNSSMLPSMVTNDHIFVNKLAFGLRLPLTETWLLRFKPPHRGEVIVFKYPRDTSTFFIKRVIGEPGDKIEIREGFLYVNSVVVERKVPTANRVKLEGTASESFDSYIPFIESIGSHEYAIVLKRDDPAVQFGPVVVPEGHLFVLGDNRHNSSDSRVWGALPMDFVLGRASRIWLSCEKTLPVLNFLCTPFSVRWERTFRKVE